MGIMDKLYIVVWLMVDRQATASGTASNGSEILLILTASPVHGRALSFATQFISM